MGGILFLKNILFLPRVEFDNLILSKARWKIDVSDFKKLFVNKELLTSIKKWQNENKIPDLVELVEGDNKLLIDLKSKFATQMLLDAVKKRKDFILEEFLFSEKDIIKDGKGNSYCNQFIVSFYNNEKLKENKNDQYYK